VSPLAGSPARPAPDLRDRGSPEPQGGRTGSPMRCWRTGAKCLGGELCSRRIHYIMTASGMSTSTSLAAGSRATGHRSAELPQAPCIRFVARGRFRTRQLLSREAQAADPLDLRRCGQV
jgi:hypothetical protein